MTLKERMFILIKNEGLNPNQFYTLSGLGNGYLDKVGDTFRKPTIEKIQKTFPRWNMGWILNEEGEMYTEAPAHNMENQNSSNAHVVENLSYMNVPIVHVHAKCGYLCGYGDKEYINGLPTMPIIVDRTYLGKYMIFEAEGDSMDDDSRKSICDGDKVLAREVKRELWKSKLHYNDWYFVIVHKTDGISIKKIIDHDTEKGIITCHSLNPLFKDYTVFLDEVAELYSIVKIVDRSARL